MSQPTDPSTSGSSGPSTSGSSGTKRPLSPSSSEGANPSKRVMSQLEMQAARKSQLESFDVSAAEFLRLYPKPEEVFYRTDVHLGQLYKRHSLIGLMNDFRKINMNEIKNTLNAFNDRYAPAYRLLVHVSQQIASKQLPIDAIKRLTMRDARALEELPEEPCEKWYHKKWFSRNQDKIKEYLKQRSELLMEAKSSGESVVCQVCEDDVLPDEMHGCIEFEHQFCSNCIVQSAESEARRGNWRVVCLDTDCTSEMSTTTVNLVLSPVLSGLFERRRMERDMQMAAHDRPDLATCPFCSYAAFMDSEEKILCCQNEACLIESCRDCRKRNHSPQQCDDMVTEQTGETVMRVFIERAMNEAMIRTCRDCHTPLYRTDGCNLVTCICVASMCYICRRAVCSTCDIRSVDIQAMHNEEMRVAGENAKKEFVRLYSIHPDLANIQLSVDPLAMITPRQSIFRRATGGLIRVTSAPFTMIARYLNE